MLVTGKHIHFVHAPEIPFIFFNCPQLGKNRHSHLYGIHPIPVINHIRGKHIIDKFFNMGFPHSLRRIEHIHIQIRLSATLEISMPFLLLFRCFPSVMVPPIFSIFEPTLILMLAIERHQPLIIDTTSPYLTGTFFVAHIGFGTYIGICTHKVIIHQRRIT